MRAMVFDSVGEELKLKELDTPKPGDNELLIRVNACGLCNIDLQIIDGELSHPKLPLILGHQIVGTVEAVGSQVKGFKKGAYVGVPWLGSSCQQCYFCEHDQENLCDEAQYIGYQLNGGLAEFCVANSRYCFHLPEKYPDVQIAPLICAGLIGYRALKKVPNAQRIGLYGFGSSAHILTQLAVHQKKEVYAFTKKGDLKTQQLAKELGAVWAGNSEEILFSPLDAIIIFAPEGSLVPLALMNVRKGGTVVCATSHMSEIPSFSYEIMSGERELVSVDNLTAKDGEEFIKIASQVPIKTEVTAYPLEEANHALDDLRTGRFVGAAVIKIS